MRLATPATSPLCGDSQAASELGIRSYLSSPVRTSTGSLYGTLCGASTEQNPRWRAQQLIAFFAHLIAEQVEQEQLLRQLQQANDELSRLALSDPSPGSPTAAP